MEIKKGSQDWETHLAHLKEVTCSPHATAEKLKQGSPPTWKEGVFINREWVQRKGCLAGKGTTRRCCDLTSKKVPHEGRGNKAFLEGGNERYSHGGKKKQSRSLRWNSGPSENSGIIT